MKKLKKLLKYIIPAVLSALGGFVLGRIRRNRGKTATDTGIIDDRIADLRDERERIDQEVEDERKRADAHYRAARNRIEGIKKRSEYAAQRSRTAKEILRETNQLIDALEETYAERKRIIGDEGGELDD